MGFIFGLVKRLIKLAIYFVIFAAIIVFIPNLPPYTKFSNIPLEPTLPTTGPLATNDLLNNPEKAYLDKLLGPEAFQVYKGDLYTSLATGEIVKVSPGGHVTFVTKIGDPCSGLTHEHICGRPLGFQIDENKNSIFVSDAYHGIWKVDLKNDKKQLLVSPRVALEGREPKLFNSLALSKNGDLYWTDSSSDFQLKDGAFTILTDPSGRLFHYNAAKNQSKVLLDNLWFPNGVAVSSDNQFVVISETSRYRLLKYYVDGPKKGKSEVFVAGLPGVPDNVRPLPDGSGVLVGLYTAFDADNPLLSRSMAATPLLRKFLARIQRMAEIPFEYLNTVYPNIIFEEIVYNIGHFKSVSGIAPKKTGLLHIDWNGNIVASYFNTDGKLGHISDAIVYNNRLYTGNPHGQNFIGSFPVPPQLKKAFQSKTDPKKQAKPIEVPKQAKPVEAPKPAKPVEAPKPAKPVEAPKQTKPVEAAKPKVVEKPKVEIKKDIPKPAAQDKPKQQTKPTEASKPAPKPTEESKPTPTEKKTLPKPSVEPKQAQKPTTPPPLKTDAPKVQPKQETKPTPKPEIKTNTATPKPAPKAVPQPSKTEDKSADAKPEVKAKPSDTKPPKTKKPIESQKPVKEPKPTKTPEQIPIIEEIPSDTAKPAKETLKVIKKGGPAEIPNPKV